MSTRGRLVHLLGALLAFPLALPAQDNDFGEAPTLGDFAFEALGHYREIGRLKMELILKLRWARDAYWKAYPDKPGLEQARVAYNKALSDREVYQLQQGLGTDETSNVLRAVQTLSVVPGEAELQIPYGARAAFDRWVADMRRQLPAKNDRQESTDARLVAAFKRTQSSYLTYRKLRDREEFRIAGRVPPDMDRSRWQIVASFVEAFERQSWKKGTVFPAEPYPLAQSWYQDAVRRFGQERTQAVADEVYSSPSLGIPAEFGGGSARGRADCFVHHLGTGSPENFLLAVLVLEGGYGSLTPWTDARREYIRLGVAAKGEERLLEATARVRDAGKIVPTESIRLAHLKDPRMLGSEDVTLLGCIKDLVGVGRQAAKEKTAAAWSQLDIVGSYYVQGDFKKKQYRALTTITRNADGTFAIATMIDPGSQGAPTRRAIGRPGLASGTFTLEVDYEGNDRPLIDYQVMDEGKRLRGIWRGNLGTEEFTELGMFRAKAAIGGRYTVQGMRELRSYSGTVTVIPGPKNTFSFDFALSKPTARRFKVSGKWNGMHIERAGDGKGSPPLFYLVLSGGHSLFAQPGRSGSYDSEMLTRETP